MIIIAIMIIISNNCTRTLVIILILFIMCSRPQQESSRVSKTTGWSCWHRFCDVEISRSNLEVFREFRRPCHGLYRFVVTYCWCVWDVSCKSWDCLFLLMKGFPHIKSFGWYVWWVYCVSWRLFEFWTDQDGLLDAVLSWRKAQRRKKSVNLKIIHRAFLCKTVPMKAFLLAGSTQGGMSPAPAPPPPPPPSAQLS